MKRGITFALLGVLAAAGGCAVPAQYVEKRGDSGTVAVPDNTNYWPNYNRREALALIQQHVGPNYEIIDERKVVTGQSTRNEQQTNTEMMQNRRNPNLPGERQTTTGSVTTQDLTQWQITYRKLPGVGDYPPPGAPGVTPAGGAIRTGGPGAGVVPSVLPAGGAPSRGGTSYFTPARRPAAPGDCAT